MFANCKQIDNKIIIKIMKKENFKKIDVGGRNEAGGDAKLMFFKVALIKHSRLGGVAK